MYSYSEIIDFEGENLQGADFQTQNLENSQFQGANLKRANFQGSNLRGARFQGANLKCANFQSADLHEANFKGAKLQGAKLEKCIDIKRANWKKAEYDNKTQFPFDFNPDEHGLIKTFRRNRSTTQESGNQSIAVSDKKLRTAIDAIKSSIQNRQGQKKFLEDLIKVYQGRCAITGCRVKEILEAAHVKPYCRTFKEKENHSTNGILLRADIHTLFDLNLIVVYPKTKKLEINHSLKNSRYERFNGIILPSYQKNLYSPDDYYLEWRNQNYEKHLEGLL